MLRTLTTRRHVLTQLAASAGLGLGAFGVRAQAWPAKPIRLVVPFAPGGSSQIVARATAQEIPELLGQSVYVDNKPGASGNVTMGEVARVKDQHTLILGHLGTLATNPCNFDKLPYAPIQSFRPISMRAKVPSLYVVRPELPVNNFTECIALAGAKPGQLNYGSAGNGSAGHLAFEYLKIGHQHLRRAPALSRHRSAVDRPDGRPARCRGGGCAGGDAVHQGRQAALHRKRQRAASGPPDLPTVAEQGFPGFEMTQWYGRLAPASMSQANADKLSAAAVKAMREPATAELLESDAAIPIGSSAPELAAFIGAEQKRWKPVIERARIKPDCASSAWR